MTAKHGPLSRAPVRQCHSGIAATSVRYHDRSPVLPRVVAGAGHPQRTHLASRAIVARQKYSQAESASVFVSLILLDRLLGANSTSGRLRTSAVCSTPPLRAFFGLAELLVAMSAIFLLTLKPAELLRSLPALGLADLLVAMSGLVFWLSEYSGLLSASTTPTRDSLG